MSNMFILNAWRAAFSLKRLLMDSSHSLAPAAASGSLGALVVALGQHLVRPPVAPGYDLLCPALDPSPSFLLWGYKLDLVSLIVGIAFGLTLYPLLELFFLWRAYVRACVRARLRGGPDSLYKILD